MIATIERAARALAPDRASRDKAKLVAALDEVRRLDEAHKAIEADWKRRADTSFFIQAVQDANAKYDRTQSPEDLRDLIIAEIVLERAQQKSFVVSYQMTGGVLTDAEFRSKYPNHREVLVKAVEAQLRVARADLPRIESEETERLLNAGFDEDTAEKSPIIRRARDRVEGREGLLERLKSTPAEDVWKKVSAVLDF